MANYLVSFYRVGGEFPVSVSDKQYNVLPSDAELRQLLKDVEKHHGEKLRGEVYEYRSDSVIHRFGDNN